MENKLTIAHIAPYLPYGLKIRYTDKEGDKELYVMGIHDDGGKVHGTDEPDVYPNFSLAVCWRPEHRFRSNGYFYIQANYKPILRPLSQLTQEIEHNGERFVPSEKLQEIRRGVSLYKPMSDRFPLEINIDTEDYAHQVDLYDGYLIMQKLSEWHFDVFGLLDSGLAIEKGAEG